MGSLEHLSPRSKALMVVNEYQQQSMDEQQLKSLFQEICPAEPERHAVAVEIEEALRQARYSPADIWKLLDAIYPERTSAASTPKEAAPKPGPQTPHAPPRPVGKRTQPVKTPFIKSFDDFGFDSSAKQPPQGGTTIAGAPPGRASAPKAGQASPEPAAPRDSRQISALKDTDKTAFFGATLKGISLNAVKPTTKATVLVADDDQRIRFVYRTKLEEGGYSVIEAENGMEAWRLIQTGEVNVAVLDMKMPGYHGLDVLSRMADAGMDIPVIISTAYDQLADEFVVATYPKLQYLVKPIDPNELLANIDAFVEG
ncbi:MAG: response regulator [Planctomycetes bacterium]|nr:response regulator [Planctomycetota bacterium]